MFAPLFHYLSDNDFDVVVDLYLKYDYATGTREVIVLSPSQIGGRVINALVSPSVDDRNHTHAGRALITMPINSPVILDRFIVPKHHLPHGYSN